MNKEEKQSRLDFFQHEKLSVGVIGLGYVGLPLCLTFCEAGLSVYGFDIDQEKCNALKAGKSYLSSIPSERVEKAVSGGNLSASSDFSALQSCDAILICVPTPLTEGLEPELRYIRLTAETISHSLRKGQLIVLESTTYPGTTQEVVQPLLEKSGLKCGEDFFLAYSPEREDPGNREFSTASIPKLVGGLDAFSGELVESLYKRGMESVVRVSHARIAEAAKIVENVYRSVNIALVNELKLVFEAMDIDVWEVIQAAKTKPFGFQAFYPGPGLGGHCIPIDPFYLAWKARCAGVRTRFIELAGEINAAMPQHVLRRLQEALNQEGKALKGSKILVLGVAYKEGVADTRESPGLELIHLLQAQGAQVSYHDPMVPKLEATRKYNFKGMTSVPLEAKYLQNIDALLLSVAHPGLDVELLAKHAPLILDTRNALAAYPDAKVVKA